MDNNDVELTTTRLRFDSDEVYPLEVLHKNQEDDIYQPVTQRQNKSFVLGMSLFFVFVVVLLVFGIPTSQQDETVLVAMEGQSMDQSSIMANNNIKTHNENRAKVMEAMQQHQGITHGKRKPHHPSSSSWSDHKTNKNNNNKGNSPVATTAPPESEPDTAKDGPGIPQSATTEAPMNPQEPNHHDPVTTSTATQQPSTSQPKQQSSSKVRDLEAWHAIKVTKDDGIMYEVTNVLKHDPKSFTYVI